LLRWKLRNQASRESLEENIIESVEVTVSSLSFPWSINVNSSDMIHYVISHELRSGDLEIKVIIFKSCCGNEISLSKFWNLKGFLLSLRSLI
jgi:hypothetical protein